MVERNIFKGEIIKANAMEEFCNKLQQINLPSLAKFRLKHKGRRMDFLSYL